MCLVYCFLWHGYGLISEQALEDITLDDIDINNLDKELDNDTNSLSSSISAGLSSGNSSSFMLMNTLNMNGRNKVGLDTSLIIFVESLL